jgi:hypothetical protein
MAPIRALGSRLWRGDRGQRMSQNDARIGKKTAPVPGMMSPGTKLDI